MAILWRLLTGCNSSKPIRRPQLKKVLKEYCSPIPEEDEEMTPPEIAAAAAANRGPANTTVVLINGGGAASPNASGDVPPAAGDRSVPADETNRPVSPISPLTGR